MEQRTMEDDKKDYSNSFHHYDDGTSIAANLKAKKVEKGYVLFNDLYDRYDIIIISNISNTILFSIGNKEYYFGIPSKKIRKKGNSIWTGGIVSFLKKDWNNKIPVRI